MNWIYAKVLVYQKLSGTVFTLTFDTRFYVKMQFRKDPQILKVYSTCIPTLYCGICTVFKTSYCCYVKL